MHDIIPGYFPAMARKKVIELLASGAILAMSAAMFLSAVQKSWVDAPYIALVYAGTVLHSR